MSIMINQSPYFHWNEVVRQNITDDTKETYRFQDFMRETNDYLLSLNNPIITADNGHLNEREPDNQDNIIINERFMKDKQDIRYSQSNIVEREKVYGIIAYRERTIPKKKTSNYTTKPKSKTIEKRSICI